jgi:hypothetical protein
MGRAGQLTVLPTVPLPFRQAIGVGGRVYYSRSAIKHTLATHAAFSKSRTGRRS